MDDSELDTATRPTRRQVLRAGGAAVLVGTLSGRATGQATGRTLYVGSRDDTLYALEAGSGTEQWAFETGGVVESSPTVTDGTVYVGSGDENLYALEAESGTERWVFGASAGSYSSPTVVENPATGDSVGSRARLGALGHNDELEHTGQSIEIVPDSGESTDDDSDDSSGSQGSTDDSDGSGPGFGVGGAVAGLGGVAYLLKRRLDDETGSR